MGLWLYCPRSARFTAVLSVCILRSARKEAYMKWVWWVLVPLWIPVLISAVIISVIVIATLWEVIKAR